MQRENDSLKEAKHEFLLWRKTKSHCDRIPARLWDLACLVAREHGPTVAARGLRVNGSQLKTEMDRRAAALSLSECAHSAHVAEPQPEPTRITVTKVIPVDVAGGEEANAEWEIVSPCGWRLRSSGLADSKQMQAFVSAVRGGEQ